MATPQEFFKNNTKWILGVLILLFFIKTFQGCNRNMTINQLNQEITHLKDSLSTTYGTEKETLLFRLQECEKETVELRYEVKLAESQRDEANKRADAVQSTAEKTRSNTTSTIVVKGAEQVDDIKK